MNVSISALHQNGLTSPIVTGTAPRCGSSTAPKKRKVADETFYLLWEVTGRVELPDLAEIPDADVGKDVQEILEQLTRWRIPGTEITIDRIAEGPRAGEFLFSSDTVKQAPRLYITDTLDYPPEGSPDADRG